MAWVLKITGVLFFLNGFIQCFTTNLNLGVMLTLGIGISFLIWGVFYLKIEQRFPKLFLKWFKMIVVIGLCAECILVGFIAYIGQADTVTYKEDTVIVLGAGIHGDKISSALKLRLDCAIEYHKKNPKALIVVSGGQGNGETVTEAYAMEKYLIEHHVPKEIIVKEEKATSTSENMRFSKRILDKKLGEKYSTVIITNDFHMYRAESLAKKQGLSEITTLHTGLQWYNYAPCYLRESLAVLKLWILD